MKKTYTEQIQQIIGFFETTDENNVENLEKALVKQHVIQRIETTSKDKSYETTPIERAKRLIAKRGVISKDFKLIGFGMEVFNEDIYPIQYFEIYLRNCDLVGHLNLSGCEDMLTIEVYHNRISSIDVHNMPELRILGIQDNDISELDPSELPKVQGIDAGFNKISTIDVSKNSELVEFYINNNNFSEIDLSCNKKLKYFYCHNNNISKIDTTSNPLVRHMDCTGNPLTEIKCLAPQRDEKLPLNLSAGDGGYVGLKFNPIYNAQWKETGEWEQCYFAYPKQGYTFDAWVSNDGEILSREAKWVDKYGSSREIKAKFSKDQITIPI